MAIYCIGDIHGKFEQLTQKLRELTPNSHLICVGDVGLGFEDSPEPSSIAFVNDVAAEMNINIWMIRGNHDNPYVFRGQQQHWNDSLSHIKVMGDVDSMEIEGYHVIFVGGAISVDRSHEGRIEGYSWWREEPVHESSPSRVYHIVEDFGPADLLITHAGPITALPVLDPYEPNIYHYSQEDPHLFNDINVERTRLADCVYYSRAPMVVYGHYHVTLEYHNTGVDYRCCAELEVWEFKGKPKTTHLPAAVISEEEKAKVETAPIRLKAPLVAARQPDVEVASMTTQNAITQELIQETDELRKTSAYNLTADTHTGTTQMKKLPPLNANLNKVDSNQDSDTGPVQLPPLG